MGGGSTRGEQRDVDSVKAQAESLTASLAASLAAFLAASLVAFLAAFLRRRYVVIGPDGLLFEYASREAAHTVRRRRRRPNFSAPNFRAQASAALRSASKPGAGSGRRSPSTAARGARGGAHVARRPGPTEVSGGRRALGYGIR